MSKYVKNLISDHLRGQLEGIDDALLVNVIGLDAIANNRLRTELREKDINVMVVKNSLAARATAGTPLAAMFEGLTGSAAICWGGEDIVGLAREITRLAQDKQYAAFEARGGVMDGTNLSAEQVQEVSKWPNREEMLGQLVGQILGPGSQLAAQLDGPGEALAGQIASLAEEEGEQPSAEEEGEQPSAEEA